MNSDYCKIARSVQVWGTISSRGISIIRKMNGNMDSAKYQSDIIYDIEWHVNALCSHGRDISLCMISRHAIILKELEHS